jgi:hypothetical protein
MFALQPERKLPTYFALIFLVLALAPVGNSHAPAQESPSALSQQTQLDQAAPTDHPAQAQTKETASQPSGAANAIVEEPPIYYVRDPSGRLVPLLGFSYSDLLDFIRQRHDGEAATGSGYSLEQLVITGNVQGDKAELNANYKIRLEGAAAVEIPLAAGGAVLSEPAQYEGSGEQAVCFNAQAGSYSARLRGSAGSEHQLNLKLLVPVKIAAGQSHLELTLPAAAASHLALHLDQSAVELVEHIGAATAEVKAAAGGAEVDAWGLGGSVTLRWKDAGAANRSPLLESTGEILAKIDSRSVQFEAVLTVRSFGSQFDHFQLKLPPGAQLVNANSADSGYTLTPVGASGAFVDVKLNQSTSGPVEVKLQAERAYDVTQAYDAAQSNSALELAGFEVKEAPPHRQWGHIAVAVVGEWQPVWGERNRVRQIADLPEKLKRPGVVAGFEYFGQPASLRLGVAPRKTRIAVDPEYIYFFDDRQIRLEAQLKYTIRGAKTSALQIAMPGWDIDEIGPPEVLEADVPPANAGSNLTVPLLQPVSGELQLTLKAHRDLPAGNSRVEFALPIPGAAVLGPATVALVAADNVRLRPKEAELQGLVRTAVAPRIKLPPREQLPLFFRGEQAQATFVGQLEQLSQLVSASADGNLTFDRDEIQVDQRFQFRVEHLPADTVMFDVPQTILSSNRLELLLDGQALEFSVAAGDSQDTLARIEASLPEPRIGGFEITARYRLNESAARKLAGTTLAVPLVMPGSTIALDGNRLSIRGDSSLSVQPHDENWEVDEELPAPGALNAGPVLTMTALAPTSEINLLVRGNLGQAAGAMAVQRAWIQTWIAGSVRQDRAIYRFSTAAESLEISLPSGVQAPNLELRLDGRSIVATGTSGSLKVKLPRSDSARSHLLEMRYHLPSAESAGIVEAELPRLAGITWIDRMYWQLVLPRDQHLLWGPSELTPEQSWTWNGWTWARRPTQEQSDLEAWVGAPGTAPLPEATNRYLFSTMGTPAKFVARVGARWEIVLLASIAALASGLLVMYVPAVRRPRALFVVGLVIAALALWIPEAAILFAQAATLGFAILIVSAILRRWVTRRRRRGIVIVGGRSSIVERSSARTKLAAPELAITATAPAAAMPGPSTSSSHR